jgi:hypothetical protein
MLVLYGEGLENATKRLIDQVRKTSDRRDPREKVERSSQVNIALTQRKTMYVWRIGAQKFFWGKGPPPTSKFIKRRSRGDERHGKVEDVIAQGILGP